MFQFKFCPTGLIRDNLPYFHDTVLYDPLFLCVTITYKYISDR